MVGELVAVVKRTPVTITLPDVTLKAGDWPTMVVVVPLPLMTSVTPKGGCASISLYPVFGARLSMTVAGFSGRGSRALTAAITVTAWASDVVEMVNVFPGALSRML